MPKVGVITFETEEARRADAKKFIAQCDGVDGYFEKISAGGFLRPALLSHCHRLYGYKDSETIEIINEVLKENADASNVEHGA